MTTPRPLFNVDIYFVGIFGVVTDVLPTEENPPTKLAMLVPATDLGKKPKIDEGARDGQPLYRHRWFVEYSPRQVLGGSHAIPEPTCARWIVSENNKFFRMTFESDAPNLTVASGGLDFVSDLAEIAPDYAEVEPALLGWTPGPSLGGQVMFDQGELKEPDSTTRSTWVFPPTLRLKSPPTSHLTPELSHKIHLHLKDVTRFVVKVRTRQDDPSARTLELTGGAASPVVISICNLCDVNPMRWETEGRRRVDDDFRWYYELGKNKGNLPNDLHHLDLPVPHPHGSGGGVGQNCLETKFAPQDFTVD